MVGVGRGGGADTGDLSSVGVRTPNGEAREAARGGSQMIGGYCISGLQLGHHHSTA